MDGQDDAPPRRCKQVCFSIVVILVVALFWFVNWLVYFVFSLVLPPILALFAIFGLYYGAARVAVRYFAFPGSFHLSRRKLEWQHC